MDSFNLHSPESVESVEFQNDYEHNDFNIGIGLDREDSADFSSHDYTGQFDWHELDFVSNSSCNDSYTDIPVTALSSNSTPASGLSQEVTQTFLMNNSMDIVDNVPIDQSFKGNFGPLRFTSKEKQNRKSYPIGDSNSKNAIAARDNRLKKKKYVAQLEDTVKILRSDNEALSKKLVDSRYRVCALESEVSYLKNVIANQSTLSTILSSVSQTPGISLSTSFGCSNGIEKNKVVEQNSNDNGNHALNVMKSVSNFAPNDRNLRSSLKSNASANNGKSKGVQNMTAEEIVRFCKEKKKKVVVSKSGDSETDSEVEEIDIDDSSLKFKWSNKLQEDDCGVCLHVSGTKVSLEFCASCNMKSKTDVSLDHSYSSHISK